ncbi:MAG: thioesterase [Deltaproteobacteria bacterium]|nr:thioesterase [Deltaproteobacteria bacterium]
MTDERWLPYRRARPQTRLRLFCFPFAGGSASLFRGWQAQLPADVEVCAVQLPGRERRFAEPLQTRLNDLVRELAEGIGGALASPLAFFGCSMGGWVAFELARELRRRGRATPVHLFVAACPAPHIPDADQDHTRTLDEWIAISRVRGDLDDELLANRDLLELVFPMIAADSAVTETHSYVDEAPLECPITAFAATDDRRVPVESVRAWERHCGQTFRFELVSGNHIFIKDHPEPVLETIARELGSPTG